MSPETAELIVAAFNAYVTVGVIFALGFVTRGVDRVDPLARTAPWSFRAVILPGSVLLWPVLLTRVLSGATAPPVEMNAHRRRAGRAS